MVVRFPALSAPVAIGHALSATFIRPACDTKATLRVDRCLCWQLAVAQIWRDVTTWLAFLNPESVCDVIMLRYGEDTCIAASGAFSENVSQHSVKSQAPFAFIIHTTPL